MTPALKGGHSLMHHVGDHADWKFPDTRNSPVDEGEIGVLARNRVTLNDLNILEFIITCVFKYPPLVDQTGDTAVLAHKVEAGQNLFRLVILRQLLEYLELVRHVRTRAEVGRLLENPKIKVFQTPSHVDLEGGAEVETQVVSANPSQIGLPADLLKTRGNEHIRMRRGDR